MSQIKWGLMGERDSEKVNFIFHQGMLMLHFGMSPISAICCLSNINLLFKYLEKKHAKLGL